MHICKQDNFKERYLISQLQSDLTINVQSITVSILFLNIQPIEETATFL